MHTGYNDNQDFFRSAGKELAEVLQKLYASEIPISPNLIDECPAGICQFEQKNCPNRELCNLYCKAWFLPYIRNEESVEGLVKGLFVYFQDSFADNFNTYQQELEEAGWVEAVCLPYYWDNEQRALVVIDLYDYKVAFLGATYPKPLSYPLSYPIRKVKPIAGFYAAEDLPYQY